MHPKTKKRILFVSTKVYPIRGGDTIFSYGLIYRLAKRNELTLVTLGDDNAIRNHKFFKNIDLVCFARQKGILYKILKLLINKSLLQDYSFKVKEFLKQEDLSRYEVIIIDHLRAYSVSKEIFKRNKGNARIVYMAHNVESINQKEKLDLLPKKRLLTLLSNNINRIENSMLDACDTVWAINEIDLNKLTRDHHSQNRVIKPFFPWKRIKTDKDLQAVNNELLILGSLNWYPNIQGILHFVQDIFPNIVEKNNLVKLTIVGQNPSKEILSLASSRISVYPNVESVDPFIKKADLLIIPNKSGTGSKIKLLEAIMKGLPVITYPDNIIGYENLSISKPFLVDNTLEFSESVLKAISDKELKQNFIKDNLSLLNENNVIE